MPQGALVQAYSFAELFAEKTRALFERTRPRDLYDVVFVLENHVEELDLIEARALFRGKCGSRGVKAPTGGELLRAIHEAGELRSEWANMLGHQLPQLPPLDEILARVPALLDWVDPGAQPSRTALDSIPAAAGEGRVAPRGARFWGTGVPVDLIRFAGANRLLVELSHGGRRQLIEPYALRQSRTGNLLLYAFEHGTRQIEVYALDRISGVVVTERPFAPRRRTEL